MVVMAALVLVYFTATVGRGEPTAITSEPQESRSAPQTRTFEVASTKIAADPERVPVFCIVPCKPGERLSVTGAEKTPAEN